MRSKREGRLQSRDLTARRSSASLYARVGDRLHPGIRSRNRRRVQPCSRARAFLGTPKGSRARTIASRSRWNYPSTKATTTRRGPPPIHRRASSNAAERKPSVRTKRSFAGSARDRFVARRRDACGRARTPALRSMARVTVVLAAPVIARLLS